MGRPSNTREQTFQMIMERAVRQPSGCLEWPGKVTTSGYGGVQQDGRQHYVHRFVWEELHGPIDEGMFICHHCDNPICCDPDHLFLGTPGDNHRDAQQKGRLVYPPRLVGEEHHQAKLTDDQVYEIRRRSAFGETAKSIHSSYPVSYSMIKNIVAWKNWTHLQEA